MTAAACHSGLVLATVYSSSVIYRRTGGRGGKEVKVSDYDATFSLNKTQKKNEKRRLTTSGTKRKYNKKKHPFSRKTKNKNSREKERETYLGAGSEATLDHAPKDVQRVLHL